MKITQKYIQYILLLLIVAIAAGAYYFGYVGFIEKANSVKQSNKAIEARISELNDKETQRDEWTQAIVKSDEDIKKLLVKYGPGNTPEKDIMFIRALEDASDMTVSSMTFTQDTPLFVSEDLDENGNPVTELDSSMLSIAYSTTYEGLKKCMDFINGYEERMNVSTFTASTNQETGLVTGNMVLNLYGVKDANHKYEEPFVPGISLGVDNIFGAIESLEGLGSLDNILTPQINDNAADTADTADTEVNDNETVDNGGATE